MTGTPLWTEPLYYKTAGLILVFLLAIAAFLYMMHRRDPKLTAQRASIRSWFFATPLILFVLGLPSPWPLVGLVATAMSGAKTFFKMVGIYHRSWFVWTVYFFLIALGLSVYYQKDQLYDLMPMIFLAAVCLIPLLRNSAKHMIQYIALSLMAFVFFGWSLLYIGRILMMERGAYIALYLYVLAEFSESVSLSFPRLLPRSKPFSNISSRVSTEGVIVALVLTLVLAWGLRHLLPWHSPWFWVASGILATLFGRFGNLIVSVIRRDLGIKGTGVFIIGRDDIIARLEKLIFLAPAFYYTLHYLLL